jgi:hypothetical protein
MTQESPDRLQRFIDSHLYLSVFLTMILAGCALALLRGLF